MLRRDSLEMSLLIFLSSFDVEDEPPAGIVTYMPAALARHAGPCASWIWRRTASILRPAVRGGTMTMIDAVDRDGSTA
jgi:hypothetical protein